MELKIADKIQKIRLPRLIRIIVGTFVILSGIIFSFIPIVPGAFLIIVGAALIIPGRKIIALIKIRKGIIHLIRNFSLKKLKYKIKDFKAHLKHIFSQSGC